MKEDRKEIYESVRKNNLVVEAGAGTGKTTTLITCLGLCLLENQDEKKEKISIESLVALTFTEKAAADIKQQLLGALQGVPDVIRQYPQIPGEKVVIPDDDKKTEKARRIVRMLREQNNCPTDEEIIARTKQLLLDLDKASIGTIHSFCADILREFPLEAHLVPNAKIDSGAQRESAFEARWNRFLEEELSGSSARAAQWKQVLEGDVSLDELKSFAMNLCDGKVTHYEYGTDNAAFKEKFIAYCEQARARMSELVQQGLEHAQKGTPRGIEKMVLLAEYSLQRTLAFVRGLPVPENKTGNYSMSKVAGWTDETFAEAKRLMAFAAKVTPEKQRIFLTAYELVRDVCKQVRADYNKNGLLSYDDLLIKTRDLLRDNLRVRRLLKDKFSMLFIDEFQDTDPVQGELLLFLAEEKSSCAKTWQDIELQPGKLCVVGDPKQSIYRFRGADITAYEKFTELIIKQGGKKCFLRENFRSLPEIIDTANEVCSRAMKEEPLFQPKYEPIFTSKTFRNQVVEWLFIEDADDLKAEKLSENQAETVARWISEHVGKETFSDGRKWSYRDIMVLTRAATNNTAYINAFRRYGIPLNVETDKDFFHRQEMDDMLNVLHVLLNPDDRVALAGVLRSPLGGLTDAEIYELARHQELYLNAPTNNPKAERCYRFLRQLSQKAGRLSAPELMEEIVNNSFLPEACAASYDGEKTLAFLSNLGKLLAKYDCRDVAYMDDFFKRIKQKTETKPSRVDLVQKNESTDAVSLLTIHKSKGLESPVVIFADISKDSGNNGNDPHVLYSWKDDLYGLSLGKIRDINCIFLEEEKEKHEQCEDIRCLYVALTRAKERLILVADERKGENDYKNAFNASGLLPDKNRTSPLTCGNVSVPVTYIAGQEPDTFRYIQHGVMPEKPLSLDIDAWKTSFAKRTEKYENMRRFSRKPTPSAQEEDILTQAQQQGAQLGTVCHRALELLLTRVSNTVEDAVRQAAVQQGVRERTEEALAIVEPFVQSPLFSQIKQCKLLACEMPFSCLLEDGEVSSGTMDAVFEKPDGTVWIVDYKTDQLKPGTEAAVLAQKYEGQLRAYKTAAQQIFADKQIACSAVFLRTFAAAEL